jgi:hypothetical protein
MFALTRIDVNTQEAIVVAQTSNGRVAAASRPDARIPIR